MLGILLITVQAAADVELQEQVVVVDEFTREVAAGPHLRLAEDTTASWTLEEAAAALADGEAWAGPGFPGFGITESAWWIAVTLDSALTEPQPWFARIDYPSLDRVDLYYRNASGEWEHRAAGDTLPYEDREVGHQSLAFSFPLLPAQSQTVYFRVSSEGSLQIPLSLLVEQALHRQSLIELFWTVRS